MTVDIRNLLIEKMIDRPAELSPDDIQTILHDEELREIYNSSVMLRDAMTSPTMPDPTREWKRFRSRIAPTRRRYPWLRYMAYAAAIVVLALFIPIMIRTLDRNSDSETTTIIAQNEDTTDIVVSPDIHQVPNIAAAKPAATVAHETTASPAPSHLPVAKRSSRPKNTPSPASADVDQKVRTQLARIDNEVAMALAQVYELDQQVASKAKEALCKADPTLPECNCPSEQSPENDEINSVIML
ncbi:MAG: hypothetical protein ACI4AK_06495 [Lepagella sp.]